MVSARNDPIQNQDDHDVPAASRPIAAGPMRSRRTADLADEASHSDARSGAALISYTDLPESRGKLSRCQVDDRVERDDGPELAIAGWQVKEIPYRNSVSGYARRAAATMRADRSIPTAARPWPATLKA
jgi:hypothetical protein